MVNVLVVEGLNPVTVQLVPDPPYTCLSPSQIEYAVEPGGASHDNVNEYGVMFDAVGFAATGGVVVTKQ